MKILTIGINYAPELIANAVYSTGLTEWLAEHGHQVRMVTAMPYYPAWKVSDGYPNYRYLTHSTQAGVRVTHCPLYVPSNPTGAKRILHHASFALSSLPRAAAHAVRHRPDLVLVVAPSLLSAPVGWLAAKLSGAKAWLHIQDFEVEAAFATGLLPRSGVVARAANWFEKWCLNRFDLLTSISAPMLQKLSEKGVPDHRIYEFRNWADLGNVRRLEGPSGLKNELGITSKYVALYSGNIANKQGLEILPEVAKLMHDRDDLSFAVFGDGPALPDLKKRAEGLKNMAFFPLQPKEKLNELLGMADVHLLPQIAGAADLVLPSKLTNMLASGRPVIATAEIGTALADEVLGAGLVTPPGDAEQLAQSLGKLLDDDAARELLGQAARERALERWDGDSILKRLEERLLALVGAPQTETAIPANNGTEKP